MNIVISDLKDALVKFGIKNKMLAKGDNLAIKLNDSNVCIIELGKNNLTSNQYLFYKIQVYQTGNTLESNYIRIPDFVPHGITDYYDEHNSYDEYHRGINGKNACYGYYKSIHSPVDIYESQNLLELIPGVIEDLVEVISFYNGD